MGRVKWCLMCLGLVVIASAALAAPKKPVDSISITGGKVTANGPTTTIEKGELTANIGESVAKIKADLIVLHFTETNPVGPLKTAEFSGNVSLVIKAKAKSLVCTNSSAAMILAKGESETSKQGNEIELKTTTTNGSIDWANRTITLAKAELSFTQMVPRPDGASDCVMTVMEDTSWVMEFAEDVVAVTVPESHIKPISGAGAQ